MGRRAIDPDAAPQLVFANATRRAIAVECRQAPMSIETMVKGLGWPDGHIRAHVKKMKRPDWKVLVQGANPSGRGHVYAFNENDWGSYLDDALALRPGLLVKGQRVYLVGSGSVSAARTFTRQEEHELTWAAELEPSRLLLVTEPELPTSAAQGLEARFNLAGIQAAGFTVEAVEPLGES